MADLQPPPQTTTTASGPSYIGVPSNYIAPTGSQVIPTTADESGGVAYGGTVYYGNKPLYFDGAQYLPATYSPDEIAALQSRLEALGLTGYTPGRWDPKSQAAYEELLAEANMAGKTWEEMLAIIQANPSKKGGGGGGGGLGAAPISDDDIKALGNKVAQGVLGRNLREDEIANFLPAFRGAIGGGTSAATAGENVIRNVNPGESYAHDVGNAMQMVSKMLGGLS